MNERIYDLCLSLLTKTPFSTGNLKIVIKINVLSLRNACVESGFSINDQKLEINMKK